MKSLIFKLICMPLGRGLGSLIPNFRSTAVSPATEIRSADSDFKTTAGGSKDGQLWQIPISLIKANVYQPRQNFNHQDLEELINSIKEHGVLQPLLLTEKDDGTYELIAGERRWRAAQIAGFSTVPAMIKKVSGSEKLELALIENLQRENLNPLEEAFAFERLLREFSLTQEEVAKRVGKSRPYVGNALRLLGLPEEIRKGLVAGVISRSAARALLGLESLREQLKFFRRLIKEEKSVGEIERSVAAERYKVRGLTRRDPLIIDYERKLRERLGTKVRLTERKGRGAVMIEYYSPEELKRIIKEIMR